MALELRQQLRLSQQLVMTPQLQMAIKLLQLSRLELLDTIRQELEENPTLEEVAGSSAEEPNLEPQEAKTEEEAPAKEVTIDEKLDGDIDWSNYLDEYNAPGRIHFETERRETPSFENFIAQKTTLEDHLLWQLAMTHPEEEEQRVCSLIIGNLNRDGYLDCTTDELMQLSGSEQEKVEACLAHMQTFDPTGVCARDLSECLQIQIKKLGIDDDIVTCMLQEHINHLENKNYKAIARALKRSLDDVIAAANIIKTLEPRPGRQFGGEEPQYINPDIYIYKLENEFVILLNDDGMPKLKVNSFYKSAINRSEKTTTDARDYIQDKLRSAAWLIRSIHQRQKTIYKVMESILKFQRPFFDHGIAHLKPMVLRDVAEDIGMHESTISRVTTNKYAHTPQGIFELKYFFNSPINKVGGGSIASASVLQKIKEIIAGENPRKPYSDEKISQILKQHNINVARRTVAKYREILMVLPSNKRKQL